MPIVSAVGSAVQMHTKRTPPRELRVQLAQLAKQDAILFLLNNGTPMDEEHTMLFREMQNLAGEQVLSGQNVNHDMNYRSLRETV